MTNPSFAFRHEINRGGLDGFIFLSLASLASEAFGTCVLCSLFFVFSLPFTVCLAAQFLLVTRYYKKSLPN